MRLNTPIENCEDLQDKVVDSDRHTLLAAPLEHGANTVDHLAGTMPLGDDAAECGARLLEVGRRSCEPAQARIGIDQNGSQGLTDLMGDRCGHRHEARVALQSRLHGLQRFLSSSAIAYVNARTDIAAELALQHEIRPPNFPHPTVDSVVPTKSVFNAEFFAAVECRA